MSLLDVSLNVALLSTSFFCLVRGLQVARDIHYSWKFRDDSDGPVSPFSSFGASRSRSGKKRIFIGLKDLSLIKVVMSSKSKLEALTKHGVDEKEYTKAVERTNKFKKNIQDQLLYREGYIPIEFVELHFLDNNMEELRAWAFADVETEGIDG